MLQNKALNKLFCLQTNICCDIIKLGDRMKIDKIKKTGHKYQIIFSDNTILKTYDDVILNNALLYHQDVDSELLNKLNNETSYYDIYYKAVNYISKRLRSEKEICTYIDKCNATPKEKNMVIKKLKEIGLINDVAFAKAYTADRINLSSDGPLKIKKYLLDFNISEDAADDIINSIDKDIVLNKLSKLISKKVQSSKYSGYVLKQKIVNDFINLGYDREMINDVFASINIDKTNLLKKEYDKIYKKLNGKYSDYELQSRIKNKLYQKGFTKEEIDSL